jgi:CheY-like chemotaxis protein
MTMTTATDVSGLRVLIVDDEPAIRSLMTDVFRTVVGVRAVDVAENGARALEMVDRHRYDLVVTDLLMPGMTGFEVADAVRRRGPGTRVIMLTGSASASDIGFATARGLTVLHKPIRIGDLTHAVLEVLAQPAE